MDANRWKQIGALYGEALELPVADRVPFLRVRCGDDEALRAEVESLLSMAAKSGLLDSTVFMTDEFRPSAVIAGRFRIVRLIGRGGMGEVYKAEDLHMGGSVALKNMRPEIVHNAQAVERFKREIQLAKKVTHPNVCRIYDVGFHPSSGEPAAKMFLTMELLEGQTLSHRLKDGPMSTAEALPLIQQMAGALGAAHRVGIVHRDFKTGNVMLIADPAGTRAVVMDFGLARTFSDSGGHLGDAVTQTGEVAGTPDYMAPEQLTGGDITSGTDIYAFGIVIYEMVTGKRPFQGDTPFDAAVRRLHQTPPPPRQFAPGLDSQWETAILRCLARQPEERFQNTSELLAALSGIETVSVSSRPWNRFFAICSALAILAVVAAALLVLRFSKKQLPERAQWQQLTDYSDSATDPALSPDGRMLAFKRGGGWFMDPGHIYVKLLPDGPPVQLTHDPFSKMVPAFSPDGSRVVYSVTRPGSDWEIWEASVLPGGGEPRPMLRNAEGLTWVDKQHILFSEMREPPLMAVITSTESRTASRDVYVPENSNGMAHFSALSANRRQILIVEMQPGRSRNFSDWLPCRLAPFDGSSRGKQVGPAPGHCIAAAWSPDGKWMYFSARVDEKFHLWRQRPEGGEPEQITSGPTEEEGIAVSLDGRSAITSVGVDLTTVWVHDSNGERQISGEGDAVAPSFTPDGKRVYYISKSDLWVTEVISGHGEPVLPGVAMAGYAISPDGKDIAYTTTDGSLWYGPLDRRTPPHMLAERGSNPAFSRSGDVFFRGGSTLYRVHPDGTEIRELRGNPGDPTFPILSLSPDEEWAIRSPDNEPTTAYPRKEGRPVPVCDVTNCFADWTSDGRFFRIRLPPLSGQAGVTGLILLKGKSILPALPPQGVRTRADLMKIPGAQVIPSRIVSPTPDGSSYAFLKQESRWNLYRIPLP